MAWTRNRERGGLLAALLLALLTLGGSLSLTPTHAALDAPTTLTASDRSSDQITITWSAVTGADSYEVRLSARQWGATDTSSTHTFANLSVDTNYRIDVRGVESDGTKGRSRRSTSAPSCLRRATSPIPTTIRATSAAVTGTKISSPSSGTRSPSRGYELRYRTVRESQMGTWSDWAAVHEVERVDGIQLLDLFPGYSYEVEVRGVSSHGNLGGEVASITATT